MATGKVKFFSSHRGYGFIYPDEGGDEVFVHVRALEKAGIRELKPGQKLRYDMVMAKGKESAGNLQIL